MTLALAFSKGYDSHVVAYNSGIARASGTLRESYTEPVLVKMTNFAGVSPVFEATWY